MAEVTLNTQTQRLVADAMAARGYESADELVSEAVAAFMLPSGEPTDAELDAALDEADRTGGTPVAEVREQLRREFGLNHL